MRERCNSKRVICPGKCYQVHPFSTKVFLASILRDYCVLIGIWTSYITRSAHSICNPPIRESSQVWPLWINIQTTVRNCSDVWIWLMDFWLASGWDVEMRAGHVVAAVENFGVHSDLIFVLQIQEAVT